MCLVEEHTEHMGEDEWDIALDKAEPRIGKSVALVVNMGHMDSVGIAVAGKAFAFEVVTVLD